MGKRILLFTAIFATVSAAHGVMFMSLTPDFSTGDLARFVPKTIDSKVRVHDVEVPVNMLPHGYRPEDFVLDTAGIFISDKF